MAKAIEQTPILENKEALRFLEILNNVKSMQLTPNETKIKKIVENIPSSWKL